MVLEPRIFEYLRGDAEVLEKEPLIRLAEEGQLMAYPFHGYWQCMDTKREMDRLNALWEAGQAPWKSWDN
ncbi:Glucose-1-phosphate cytidylyltransferase [Eubacterium plexicaudatum ASF492]|nr:Glucose-1-phosphate cytidylyltransferase [Eubacterium plexicaudatum ASF492]